MAGLMSRIGLFGGTFDPPHMGHAILAAEGLFSLQLDKVLWVLTPQSPLKDGRTISPVKQRIELVQTALAETPGFELSTVDIDRKPPFYAVDTVRLIKQKYPNTEVVYLMGGDSLQNLPEWYRPQLFVQELYKLGVYHRPGATPDMRVLEKQIPGISEKIQFFSAPQIEISGADIRQRIRDGRPFRFFLNPAVYDLIQRHNYYRP